MSGGGPVLDQLNLVVGDMRASAAFYRLLGLRVPEQSDDAFHASAETGTDFDFDLDSTRFAQVWNAGWAGRDDLAGRVVIGFGFATREKIDAVYGALTAAGHRGLQPPFDAFWGARYAIVEDPNGVAVGLMSPVDPSRRYWPPANWSEGGQ